MVTPPPPPLAVIVTVAALVTGCGGGGGPPAPGTKTNTTSMTTSNPPPARTLMSRQLRESNFRALGWNVDPQVDLPRDGRGGLRVIRPEQGGASFIQPVFDPRLFDILEPARQFDRRAQQRIEDFAGVLWILYSQAYRQWTRHLDYDPGDLTLQIGRLPLSPDCGAGNLGCYDPGNNIVILNEETIVRNYRRYLDWLLTGNEVFADRAIQELFFVFSHEAAHQFDYQNPNGTTDGCGAAERCHAPYGSGSIASYDHLRGGRVRYHVTEEDIRHIPNATWNDEEWDRYSVSLAGAPAAIEEWGVWIDHYFAVSGQTAPGRLSGGNLSILDDIVGTGWIRGVASENVSLMGSATWGGQENFLGVDTGADYLGALLRADANLRYTFGDHPNLNLRIHNFEAHYYDSDEGAARWHDHTFNDWGDFRYDLDCTANGCANAVARTKWYASDRGDPAGWIGGVVNDPTHTYAGSFVAEKD